MTLNKSSANQTPVNKYPISDHVIPSPSDEENFAAVELPADLMFKEGADEINGRERHGRTGRNMLEWCMGIAISAGILLGIARFIEFII